MKLSLMTINMLLPVYVAAFMDQDMEDARELYEEMMDLVQRSGFQTVDITSLELDLFSADAIKEILTKRGLGVSSLIHFGQFASTDEEAGKIMAEKAKKAIDLAAEFGTDVVMLVPQAQEDIAEHSRQALAESLVRNWTPVAQYGKERKVHVVVEDTPDLRIPLCTTEELRYVLDRVPELEMVYDSGNMILVGEDPVQYFDTFADRIGYIHLKDMKLTGKADMFADTAFDGRKMTAAPSGRGMVDFPALLEHIVRSGYSGRCTVEFAKGDEEYLDSLILAREYFEKLM